MTKETQTHEEDIQNINYHQTNQSEQKICTGGNFILRLHSTMSGDIFDDHNWNSVAGTARKGQGGC